MTSCRAQDQKKMIYYEFPANVTTVINEYIEAKFDQDSTLLFAAEIWEQESNRYVFNLTEYNKGDKIFKEIDERIVSKSNRVAKIGKFLVPIFLSIDLQFTDFGSEKLPNGRIAKNKIMYISEGFSITFNRSGNIFEK